MASALCPERGLALKDQRGICRLNAELLEMTEAGVRRKVQAHSAGLDVVIGINDREVLRFLAPKRGPNEPAAAARPVSKQSLKFPAHIDAIARHSSRSQSCSRRRSQLKSPYR
jgi:hypothetical protein